MAKNTVTLKQKKLNLAIQETWLRGAARNYAEVADEPSDSPKVIEAWGSLQENALDYAEAFEAIPANKNKSKKLK